MSRTLYRDRYILCGWWDRVESKMARPRVFDVDKAVETATELFWRNGYERTSLADLTTAMGITPPSFYFAFGSKEGLFKRALQHYYKTRLSRAEQAFDQPTSRGLAE